MPMRLKGILTFAAVVGVAGAASAADIYQAPPPISSPIYSPAPVFSWTGFYLGVQGGYDWNSAATVSTTCCTAQINGGIAGVYAGYNWQLPSNLVLGVEGSINYDWAIGPVVGGPPGNFGEVDWKGFVKGRVGYAMDRVMPYLSAGAAVAPLKNTGANPTANPVGWGWTVGGGVEVAVTDNVVARLDYSYADFGTYTYTAPAFTATNKSHTLMGGIAIKF